MKTRTGGFGIGLRRGWSDWQKDLAGLLSWAKAQEMGVIDLGGNADQAAGQVTAAGLEVGSVDMPGWSGMLSPDKGKRAETLAKNAAYVEACAKLGVTKYFVVMIPEKPELKRSENFGTMVESMRAFAPVLERAGGRLVIEGWPGPGALCCTPETYRALFREVPSKAMGINYDPSHLIRMGIDPIRFLEEFGEWVGHVHGKDTEILTDVLYEFGTEQPPTFGKGHGFGSWHWRYTIPGHGVMRWTKGLEILRAKGYKGAICIELEDENFNGTKEGEQMGFLSGGRFLAGC